MSVANLKHKFDTLLGGLTSTPGTRFSTTVESAYEAVVLADVMREYSRVHGGVRHIVPPATGSFLNQAPAKFRKETSFKIKFMNGKSFYFAADTEVFGLVAWDFGVPTGMLFEADVVVIFEDAADEVINNYHGYPAPQHLNLVVECKFGKFSKGQLRELLGLRRHISLYSGGSSSASIATSAIYSRPVQNAEPKIAIIMARPISPTFVDKDTAIRYDLQQLHIA